MRIYRNEYKVDGESEGFCFFTTRVAARAARNAFHRGRAEEGDTECVEEFEDVDLTRAGVLSLLRKWAAHPDNG